MHTIVYGMTSYAIGLRLYSPPTVGLVSIVCVEFPAKLGVEVITVGPTGVIETCRTLLIRVDPC